MARLSVVAISGSPSPTSKTGRLADYVLRMLSECDVDTNHVQVRSIPADALLRGDTGHVDVAAAAAAVDAADGVIVATPIYKASYSGLLKAFLDLLPQFAFAGKVLLPCATGGSLAHVLALDYALRPVLQSMAARHIVQSQFVPEAHMQQVDQAFEIAEPTAAMLREAVHHFHCSLGTRQSDPLLGHPRPQRDMRVA